MIDKSVLGHMMAVNASGAIAKFQCVHGFCLMLALPVGLVSLLFVRSVWSVGLALVVTMIFTMIGDVWVARNSAGMSSIVWIKSVVFPVCALAVMSFIVGMLPSFVMPPSIYRVLITSLVTIIAFCPMVWLFVLSRDEHEFLKTKMRAVFHISN